MTVYLNKDYEIYESDGDASLKVCIADEMVRIHVYDDAKSREWFGELDVSFSLEVAEKLAQAIQMSVVDLKDQSK